MKLTLYTLLLFAATLLTAQTATKEQIISDLPEIEITEGIGLRSGRERKNTDKRSENPDTRQTEENRHRISETTETRQV